VRALDSPVLPVDFRPIDAVFPLTGLCVGTGVGTSSSIGPFGRRQIGLFVVGVHPPSSPTLPVETRLWRRADRVSEKNRSGAATRSLLTRLSRQAE